MSILDHIRGTKYREGAVQCNKMAVVMGKLIKITDNKGFSHLSMQPKIIMGENKQSLMQFLDNKIVHFSNRAKIFTGVGTAILFSHLAYKKITKLTQ